MTQTNRDTGEVVRDARSNWCCRCFQYDTQPAGDKCGNPGWHLVPLPVPRLDEVRLPYAED